MFLQFKSTVCCVGVVCNMRAFVRMCVVGLFVTISRVVCSLFCWILYLAVRQFVMFASSFPCVALHCSYLQPTVGCVERCLRSRC